MKGETVSVFTFKPWRQFQSFFKKNSNNKKISAAESSNYLHTKAKQRRNIFLKN